MCWQACALLNSPKPEVHPSCSFQCACLTSVPFNIEELNAIGDGEGGGGSREDYSAEDVEYYFNYSGILAERGSYDQLEDLLECELVFPLYASCTSLGLLTIAHFGLHLQLKRICSAKDVPHDAYIQSYLSCWKLIVSM